MCNVNLRYTFSLDIWLVFEGAQNRAGLRNHDQ